MANGTDEPVVTRNWTDTQQTLAMFIPITFVFEIIIWMFFPPKGDPGAIAVLNTLIGAHGGFSATVVSYYFGSSKGSKEKDDNQARVAEKLAEKVPNASAVMGGTVVGAETIITTAPAEPSTTPTITTVTTEEPKKD